MLKLLALFFSFLALFHSGTASPRFSIKEFRNLPQSVHNGGAKGPGDTNLGPVTDFECSSGKSISANPNDCAQYYTCYAGEPVYLWQCYSDFLFDLSFDGCNFRQNVQCGSRPIIPGSTGQTTGAPQSTTTTSTIPPPSFICPSDNGFFGIPGQCSNQFYTCVDGEAYVSSCPPNTLFDPVTLLCASESNISCKNFVCPGNGFFPLTPDACVQSYYICFDNEAILSSCPGVSFYDPSTLTCRVDAPCLGTDGTTTSTAITSSTVTITTSLSTSDSTVNETTITTSTTTSETTSTSTPNIDTTTRISTTTSGSQETTTNTNICYPDPNGFYPYPGDCTKYYACSNGNPFVQNCSPGLVFNPVLETCDYPNNVPGCN